jgi:hypothetical protein
MAKLRKIRSAGRVARMREKRDAYRISVGNREEYRLLGGTRRRKADNIKMNLR